MSEDTNSSGPFPATAPSGMAWLALAFFGLAVLLLLDLWGAVDPVTENVPVASEYVSKDTVRDPLLSPRLQKAQFKYRCNECHQNFTPSSNRGVLLAEHTDIVLNHGANSKCLNCHNRDDWETLKDYEGNVVAFETSELLCRKCHGPKYRDWMGGAHGRPNGYWDLSRGTATRATCVQCHDPHSPKFKPVAPAPAPLERRTTRKDAAHRS